MKSVAALAVLIAGQALAAPRAHPRLQVDAALIGQIRGMRDAQDPSDRLQKAFDLRQGYAALLVKTLAPSGFRYRVVGGREPAETADADLYGSGKNAQHFHRHLMDFSVKDFSEGVMPGHKSANCAPAFAIEAYAQENIPTFEPGHGRWRVSVFS